MVPYLLAFAYLVLRQAPSGEPPILRVGQTLEGEITDAASVVHAPTLDRDYTDTPVVGTSFAIEVEESGPYKIELRSYLFDAYLVLRDVQGKVVSEDDDGGIGTHARIVSELELGASYRLDACALHGARGTFKLELEKGKPAALSSEAVRAARRVELERTVAAREKALGPDHPDTAAGLENLAGLLQDQGDYAAARPYFERALAIREKALGPVHRDTATSLNDLAVLLQDQGDYAAARPYLERALAIWEKALGPEHPDTATCLNNLALLLQAEGDYVAARPYLERALAIWEKALGPEHPDTATCLNNLALLLQAEGDYVAARPCFERALAIWEKALGPEHPDTATSLQNLANLLRAHGDYAAARPYFERALAIDEKALGPEHPGTATCLTNFAGLFKAQGDYAAARPYFERALAIYEKALRPEHPWTATSLNNLASLLADQGDYAAARPYLERALAIREKALGPVHPDTAASLNNLAILLQAQGDYAAARPYFERALAIREKALGPEHPATATCLENLAILFRAQGDYAAARPYFERALAIREKRLGSEHPDTAGGLENLAGLLQDQGDYAAARPYFERALAIREKALGPVHRDTATSLNDLAVLLQDQGDYAAARPYLERALAISEKALGPEHPHTATCLNNLALLLQDQGDYAAARPYLERALAIREKALGPVHRDTATSLNNYACLLRAHGDYATARPYFERALAIDEKALGPEHPDTARSLNNLAGLLQDQGDYAAARPYFERALAIDEKALGLEHPHTIRSRYNLGTLVADAGLASESLDLARQGLTSSLAHAQSTLWSLSEKERMLFLREGENYLSLVLSLAARPEQSTDKAAAYDLSLAWRGLVSRTLLESRARLEANLPVGAARTIESLRGVQAELSKRLYATEIQGRERHEREIRNLRDQRNELEVKVQRLGGPSLARAPTLTELEKSLASSDAFLDCLVHPLYQPAEYEGEKFVRKGEWTEDHLSAWIVRKEHELVHVDLGPAAAIENAAHAWLMSVVSDASLLARGGISVKSAATSDDGHGLTALLWKPLAAGLAGVTRVFVRPDSFLGTLPFAILPLEDGKYLIEEKDFVYVQAPDDIVRGQVRSSANSLLAVGGVDFEKRCEMDESSTHAAPIVASASLADEVRGRLSGTWDRLAHTVDEARAIDGLFKKSASGSEHLLLTDDQPTEERLKRELPRHAYVHLATHGFFHPAGTVSLWDSAREAAEKEELRGLEQETRGLVGELPGLLSGLVCAGANKPPPAGRDDGLLTAEEVLWLDLSKVELVVLSACETALGERRAGEGMIGLRRAFGLAGAKTVVSSLWSVKDLSTSELMQRFYENLLVRKQGRAEALRNAQLALLAQNRTTEHDGLPSTWGAFVLSGEWR